MQAVGPGAAAERGPQHGRPDVEHGEGAAGQRAVLRQGEPGPGLQILHVPDAHHEAGGTQPDHGESSVAMEGLGSFNLKGFTLRRLCVSSEPTAHLQ